RYTTHHHLHSFPTRRSSDLDNENDRHPADQIIIDCVAAAPETLGQGREFDRPREKADEDGDKIKRQTGEVSVHRIGAVAFHDIEDRKSTRLNSSHVKISYAV